MRQWYVGLVFVWVLCGAAVAERASLFQGGGGGRALIAPEPANGGDGQAATLFIGKEGKSMFRALPPRDVTVRRAPAALPLGGGTSMMQLFALIGHAESRRDGYDAVQHGARIRPGKRPTTMTVAEIERWIVTTPGQPHAIGRYQFIPATFRRLIRALGVGPNHVFSPRLQDQMASLLLEEAGWTDFQRGAMSKTAFMNNLAKIWAGLPNASGQSHYHGYAGNKASMSWVQFQREMQRIFPSARG